MKAKKEYGQNFLIDETIIKSICDGINASTNDLILEIGPGQGALTKYLAKIGCNVVCIEIDKDMRPYLNKYESDKLKVYYQDILSADLNKILADYSYNKLYVVGNLPYYITSPILDYLIKSNLDISEMTFMVQEEVAKRFSSLPGHKEYGYMTVYLNNYYDVKYDFFVDRTSFNPIPKVDSAIIRLYKKESYIIDGYFDFLKQCFSQKRKTLKNNLREYDFNKIKDILDKYNLNENVRAEELSDNILKDIFCNLRR